MARNKNNGNHDVDLGQPLLQVEPAQTRQPYVQHQTARHIRPRAGQKLLRRGKGLNPQTRRPNQTSQALSH